MLFITTPSNEKKKYLKFCARAILKSAHVIARKLECARAQARFAQIRDSHNNNIPSGHISFLRPPRNFFLISYAAAAAVCSPFNFF